MSRWLRQRRPPAWTPLIAVLVALGTTGAMAATVAWQLADAPTAVADARPEAASGDSPPLYPEPPPRLEIPATRPVPFSTAGARTAPATGAPRVPAAYGIPGRVLAAYQNAVDRLARTDAGCGLELPLLAAIGRVESGHARGGDVHADGKTRTSILGPRLDGGPGVRAIRDTDDGAYDGDTVWDRAVGSMQFIPSTWRRWASDGNRDGTADPHNVDDASLAAGRYLCAAGGDLRRPAGLRRAVLAYNHSESYLNLVLSWMRVYSARPVPVAEQPDGAPSHNPETRPAQRSGAPAEESSPRQPSPTQRPPEGSRPGSPPDDPAPIEAPPDPGLPRPPAIDLDPDPLPATTEDHA